MVTLSACRARAIGNATQGVWGRLNEAADRWPSGIVLNVPNRLPGLAALWTSVCSRCNYSRRRRGLRLTGLPRRDLTSARTAPHIRW